MRNAAYQFMILCTLCTIISSPLHAQRTLARIASVFRSYSHTALVEEEYPIAHTGTVTVKNIDGNITVRTEWRTSVQMKITKRATSEDILEQIQIKAEKGEDGRKLDITASCNESGCAVDITLLVPTHINLCLKTADGTITVQEVNGSVVAQTKRGSITIQDVSETVLVETKERGDITLTRIGSVKAMSASGTITAHEIARSIAASTQDGDINVSMSKLPEAGSIALHVAPGRRATLQLPKEYHTSKQARPLEVVTAGRDTGSSFTADHYILVAPQGQESSTKKRPLDHKIEKLCRCSEAEQTFIGEKAAQLKSKFRRVLAQTGKYFYPSHWFKSRKDDGRRDG